VIDGRKTMEIKQVGIRYQFEHYVPDVGSMIGTVDVQNKENRWLQDMYFTSCPKGEELQMVRGAVELDYSRFPLQFKNRLQCDVKILGQVPYAGEEDTKQPTIRGQIGFDDSLLFLKSPEMDSCIKGVYEVLERIVAKERKNQD